MADSNVLLGGGGGGEKVVAGTPGDVNVLGTAVTVVSNASNNYNVTVSDDTDGDVLTFIGSGNGDVNFPAAGTQIGWRTIIHNGRSSGFLRLRVTGSTLSNIPTEATVLVIDSGSTWNVVNLSSTAPSPSASTTIRGIAELATPAEVLLGTDNLRIVTPLTLRQQIGDPVSTTELTAGTETTVRRFSPADIRSMIATHSTGGDSGISLGDHVLIDHNPAYNQYDVVEVPLTLDREKFYWVEARDQDFSPASFIMSGARILALTAVEAQARSSAYNNTQRASRFRPYVVPHSAAGAQYMIYIGRTAADRMTLYWQASQIDINHLDVWEIN